MQLIPKYWTLTVAYGCVTFMGGLKTSQSFVGRPLEKKNAEQNMQASRSLVQRNHVTAWAAAMFQVVRLPG